MSNINKHCDDCISMDGISWSAPEHDRVALNTDGSVVELGNNAACGGLLCDNNSRFLVVFAAR
ncbi:hypothetical protein TSUD_270080 [Trifolium subterraneum]|uniref:Uncharacterized protein n=1 Tax=Trifolium subterraneum TaxID=3900 RepID=A0A2Z6N7M9_TRISU|nr:hypothetical protein TSUD_270080 [Trifolium subterraneum]